jgi:RNA polymerase sigma-70 factor (ECF subfamily)
VPASDEELARRAQTGDRQALGELYDRHHENIFKFILVRVGHQPLAEDLTGEVFVRMLDGLPRYRAMGIPFSAWLYRITRNLLTDHYRKEGRYVMTPLGQIEDNDLEQSNPPSAVERRLTLERIQRALARLDRLEADVIVLRFLMGLSLKEAAQALEKSVSAIKALQHRGLASLRAALREEQR